MTQTSLQIEHFRIAELAARTAANIIERRTSENPSAQDIADRITAAWMLAYNTLSGASREVAPEAAQSGETA